LTAEIIDIRRFSPQDFSALLEAESHAWGEGLRWDFESSARVIFSCLREKRLAGYALVAAGTITGYCFFFCDGEKGLIGDLFVHSSEEKRESALLLLEHVIETLQGTPGLRRIEAQLPHFSFEELEPCFRARGFRGFRRSFMAAPLGLRRDRPETAEDTDPPQAPPHPPLAETFRMAPWERRFDREVAELLFIAYQEHVDAMINDQYASVAGANRLVENIARHQGCGEYLPHISRVMIHQPTGQLAAVLAVTRVRPRTAHIPQVAVGQGFQGHGLGSALIGAAYNDLAAQGFQEVSLTVTDMNAGAVRLYERLGFKTFRNFGAFVFLRTK